MFAMSRADLRDAYRCGTYHRQGRKACTSHHIRVDKLDELLKLYLRKVRDNSADMLAQLNADLDRETEDIQETERSAANLEEVLAQLQEELKATKRQRIRDIMKHPDREAILEETYDELEEDLTRRIDGLQNQIQMTVDRRNTIIRVNRAAKTALEVFDDVLNKDKLDRNDLQLLIDKIVVYEGAVDIRLKADIDALLRCGVPEEAANFRQGIVDSLQTRMVQRAAKRPDKVYGVNVINDGDPLEIFTDKDGELIFKKYSPIGELGDFAAQICDSLRKSTDGIAAVCDRDSVIAIAGGARRELLEKPISPQLAEIMDSRAAYRHAGGNELPVTQGDNKYRVSVAAPVISEGDLMGSVLFVSERGSSPGTELESKLAQTAACFLGKQMES